MTPPAPRPTGGRRSRVVREVRPEVLDPADVVEVDLPDVPKVDTFQRDGSALAQALMPLVGMIGFSFIYLVNPSLSSVFMGAGLVFATMMSSVGMAVLSRRQQARRMRRTKLAYLLDLREARRGLAETIEHRRADLRRSVPHARELPVLAHVPERLWQRTPGDPDFLCVRLGAGPLPWRLGIKPTASASEQIDLDIACTKAQTDLVRLLATVRDWPVVVPLARFREVTLCGDRATATAVARSLIAQAAMFHGPDGLTMVFATDSARMAEWRWCRWLPHLAGHEQAAGRAESTSLQKPAHGGRRMAEDRQRADDSGHTLIVVDGEATASLIDRLPRASDAFSVIRIAETPPAAQTAEQAVLECRADGRGVLSLVSGDPQDIEVETLAAAPADAVARSLAHLALASDAVAAAGEGVGLDELVPTAHLDRPPADIGWVHEESPDFLRADLGLDGQRRLVRLDLKESARGGAGPHGAIVGATGSGKSELLRTLVASLAVRHHTDDLAMMLADFKGGATFVGLSALPHVCGVVTNLEGDATLVDRIKLALEGELQRRQEVLADRGVSSLREYRALRQTRNTDWEPLPHLLVIVDEFSELIEAHHDFVETFTALGRLGRSLGLHLLICSQRLDEGRMRGLESHLSYRVALRTFNAADSVAAIGVRDAFHLPSRPGAAILKAGGDSLRVFQSGYVSGRIREYRTGETGVVIRTEDGDRIGGSTASHVYGPQTVVDRAVTALQHALPAVRQIWLPPLPGNLPLRDFLAEREQGTAGVRVPFGLLDQPSRQRTETLLLDLGGSSGTTAVVGAAQTGKTTMLRTVVLSAASLYPPTHLGFVVVDYGGGLSALRELPHVMRVVSRGSEGLLQQTIDFLQASLLYREQALSERGLDGAEHLRAAWTPQDVAQAGPADLILVLDDFAEIKRKSEDFESVLSELMARGPGLGVHVVLTGRRWGDFRPSTTELVPSKLEFRLNDVIDSMYQRRGGQSLDGAGPGRALCPLGLVQVAEPHLVDADDEPGTRYARSIEYVLGLWGREQALSIPTLPSSVELAEVSALAPDSGERMLDRVVVGLRDVDRGVETQDLLGAEPGLIVLGGRKRGKTSALRAIVEQLAAAHDPDSLRLIVIDPRLEIIKSLPEAYVQAFAASSVRAEHLINELVSDLGNRLPKGGVATGDLLSRERYRGPRTVVVVDNAQVISRSALAPLNDWLPLGPLLGLTTVVACDSGQSGAGLPGIVDTMRSFGAPMVLLGKETAGRPVFGHLPVIGPPGRARYDRSDGSPSVVIQVPWAGAAGRDGEGEGRGGEGRGGEGPREATPREETLT
ncbi:type VII secretion protein EccCa [Streptomyces sp. NPDC048639]|uniref:type VII secretion protein EccCa n=1 Tax=Streptomyces sp. NPDC048639 TaxID=3365581 RepID=UPI00371BD413